MVVLIRTRCKRYAVENMSVGVRLREERLRLGMSQPAFATLAGATKSGLVKWENDSASPNAKALACWAEAGADALYILTGRRTEGQADDPMQGIKDRLADIRRDMLVQTWEGGLDGEAEVMKLRSEQLHKLLVTNASRIPPELAEEAESLIEIINNPVQLAAFRAADHIQLRGRRKQMRDTIGAWTDLGDYQPNEPVLALMTTIALDYSVPVSLLAELVYEIVASDDGGGARSGAFATGAADG